MLFSLHPDLTRDLRVTPRLPWFQKPGMNLLMGFNIAKAGCSSILNDKQMNYFCLTVSMPETAENL